MKLHIQQVDGDGINCSAVRIVDDRGQKVPCVRSVVVNHTIGGPAFVTVELVVNGRDIVFGLPPVPVRSANDLRELITRAMPRPNEFSDWETLGVHKADGTFEGEVRFTWFEFRFTVNHVLQVAEVKGGMLGATPVADVIETILKGHRS